MHLRRPGLEYWRILPEASILIVIKYWPWYFLPIWLTHSALVLSGHHHNRFSRHWLILHKIYCIITIENQVMCGQFVWCWNFFSVQTHGSHNKRSFVEKFQCKISASKKIISCFIVGLSSTKVRRHQCQYNMRSQAPILFHLSPDRVWHSAKTLTRLQPRSRTLSRIYPVCLAWTEWRTGHGPLSEIIARFRYVCLLAVNTNLSSTNDIIQDLASFGLAWQVDLKSNLIKKNIQPFPVQRILQHSMANGGGGLKLPPAYLDSNDT